MDNAAHKTAGQAVEAVFAGEELAEEPFEDEPDDDEPDEPEPDESEPEDAEPEEVEEEDELAESPLSFFGAEPSLPDSLPDDSEALRESVR